jgi:methyltransferase-like protein
MANGMIEPASSADVFVTEVSQRPQASRVARFEAQTSSTVTNRQHHQHTLDDDTRNIIQFLDGKHDHEALLGQLMAAVNRGDLSILIGGLPATSEQAVADTLRERLQRSLANLAANALLVA